MATMRRLSDGDVRAIFESLHGSSQPPPHLNFQIVPVGPNGLKLSPPSFEFEGELWFRNDSYGCAGTMGHRLILLEHNVLCSRWTLRIIETREKEKEVQFTFIDF